MPRSIAVLISFDKATLKEMQEFYSIEDVYKMLEVVSIDHHNRKIASKGKK